MSSGFVDKGPHAGSFLREHMDSEFVAVQRTT